MKSIITRQEYLDIYKMLDEVSPVDYDCGELCEAACCSCASSIANDPDEDMGIFLLPGEDKVYFRNEEWLGWSSSKAEDYEFPDSWHGTFYFLYCKANCHCDRALRPMQCRTFPLQPHIDFDGKLCLIYDTNDLPYSCPLIVEREKYPLQEDFIKATYKAWNSLMREPKIADLIWLDAENRINDGEEIIIVYKE
ncbi:MAG: hypothetical protein PUD55_05375 [Firmicutes bacterium]|nr:hypothetical protein [Bacillota bacterium]